MLEPKRGRLSSPIKISSPITPQEAPVMGIFEVWGLLPPLGRYLQGTTLVSQAVGWGSNV